MDPVGAYLRPINHVPQNLGKKGRVWTGLPPVAGACQERSEPCIPVVGAHANSAMAMVGGPFSEPGGRVAYFSPIWPTALVV